MTVAATSTATSTAQIAAQTATAASLAADKTMFLKLLTTQMQNQDPLNPMDTSQYTQQLVQFSQVEQAMQQTTALNNILSTLSRQDLTAAANTIGHVALFDSPVAGLSEMAPAQWTYSASRVAASLNATITDASGQPVFSRALDGQSGTISWDGTLADGTVAPAGSYILTIAASDAGGSTVPVTIAARGLVREIGQDNGGLTFDANGASYDAATLLRVGGTS